jgi:hypothetical protein
MHEPEKSASVIVAGKPTNKAVRAAAEPAEPRTEAKGNADQWPPIRRPGHLR